jgi:putative phosphoribosyl transferase
VSTPDNVFERDDLHDKTRIFRDRGHAGQCLSGMLKDYRGANALVLAIPAGGIPVAASLAVALELPLDVIAVSKMTLPRSTEVGYGAVAFDSSMMLNSPLIRAEGLTELDIRHGVHETAKKVRRRMMRLRGSLQLPNLSGRHVFLVDDGLASGYTMLTAIEAARRLEPASVMVAVPTGQSKAVADVARRADRVYCANIRSGPGFSVAAAYVIWRDVFELEAEQILADFRMSRSTV